MRDMTRGVAGAKEALARALDPSGTTSTEKLTAIRKLGAATYRHIEGVSAQARRGTRDRAVWDTLR